MTTVNRLNLPFVFLIVLYLFIGLVGIRCQAGMFPRQKGIVQKESAADSVYRNKIDSRLLQALAQQKREKPTGAETKYPVEVGADSTGNLPVDISATITDSLLHTITALGGKIIYPSKVYRTVRAVVNLSVIKTIALRQDVSFIQPAGQAQNNGTVPRPGVN